MQYLYAMKVNAIIIHRISLECTSLGSGKLEGRIFRRGGQGCGLSGKAKVKGKSKIERVKVKGRSEESLFISGGGKAHGYCGCGMRPLLPVVRLV
jgi:hypothetical protein